MGEHGFVGLGLYLLLLLMSWLHCSAIVRLSRGQPELAWAHEFGSMMQVSLVGFTVGGDLLSLVNYDVPYYLMAASGRHLRRPGEQGAEQRRQQRRRQRQRDRFDHPSLQ